MVERLAEIRQRIDELDSSILKLISDRAALAQEVARIKQSTEDTPLFYRPEREAQVLRKVIERNTGPLDDEEVARLFREIMSSCLALEKPLKIAYLGPQGTFTQTAALKHFGHAIETVSLPSIDGVFREVEASSADYGVVPVENSTEGVINHTLDMLTGSPLQICGEVELRIHLHLMRRTDDKGEIRRIYSHAQPLAQSREWLDTHLAGIERIAVSSNAEAARMAANEKGTAAVAGEAAAHNYELRIEQHNIEDHPDNTTRFLVLSNDQVPASGDDKTSILVATRNQPGSLSSLLVPFARNDVSMTRIESRPSRRGMWDYVFFLDIEGHQDDATVQVALKELHREASLFKILGSYPKAVL